MKQTLQDGFIKQLETKDNELANLQVAKDEQTTKKAATALKGAVALTQHNQKLNNLKAQKPQQAEELKRLNTEMAQVKQAHKEQLGRLNAEMDQATAKHNDNKCIRRTN